jgi:flagellar biosynthesis/type III secretory pathway M-ring protein FliF/YscJ
VYKNIFIWEQGEVPLKPLAIVMLVFLIFVVVMIIWYVLIKLRMQNAQQRLKYLSEEGHK